MASKKICFIIPSLNAGGIENYLLRVLNFLPDTGGITVMVRKSSKGDLYEEYKKTNAAIRFQSVGYLNLKKIYRLYSFFKKEKFDTVCDFGGNFAGVSLVAAAMAGVPKRIVFYRRSTNAFKESRGNLMYAKFANKLVNKFATRILSNSGFAFQSYFSGRDSGDNRFRVIPNGVNAAVFTSDYTKEQARGLCGIPQNAYVVGHIGRYDKAKNHETIFKAAKELTAKFSDMVFLFCGKDTDSPAFGSKLEEYGITGKTYTLGLRKDLSTVLKCMDLFYFPSVTEGQPNALIEAIMAGLPVLASSIAPIKEVIPAEGHKFLLEPTDTDLAVQKISELKTGFFNDTLIRYKQEIVSKFDLEKNLKLFQDEL